MRIKIVQRAELGERYARSAWDSQVGKTVPFRIGERSASCRLLAAAVSDDGDSVELTIETDAIGPDFDAKFYEQRQGMSIGFTAVPAEPLRMNRADWAP